MQNRRASRRNVIQISHVKIIAFATKVSVHSTTPWRITYKPTTPTHASMATFIQTERARSGRTARSSHALARLIKIVYCWTKMKSSSAILNANAALMPAVSHIAAWLRETRNT